MTGFCFLRDIQRSRVDLIVGNHEKKGHNLYGRALVTERNSTKIYSGMGAVSGICSLALASARTIFTSTACSEVLRTVASSLIRRYFARSSIFFSLKESGLVRLR